LSAAEPQPGASTIRRLRQQHPPCRAGAAVFRADDSAPALRCAVMV